MVVVFFFEENDDDKHRLAIGSSATRLSVLFRANSASENTQTTVASTSNEGARKCAEALDDDDDEDEDQERISSRCGKTHARNVSRTRTRASRSDDDVNDDDDDIALLLLLLLLLL